MISKKTIFCLLFTIIHFPHVFSQGGVDVGYLSIEQLTDSMIAKDVKPDFISFTKTDKTIDTWEKEIRKDTFFLNVFGEDILFIEQRKRYVDAYNYHEQYLESTNYSPKSKIRIHHTVIESIKPDKILLRFYFEVYPRALKNSNCLLRRTMKSIWINKSQLDGFLIQI